MPRLFHPLLRVLANATHRELAAQVQYHKVGNEILRFKLHRRGPTIYSAIARQKAM